jgi:uncharacterized integral membrane protein
MYRKLLLVLLFVVVLVFVVFLGLNWETQFHLRLGFGSRDIPVSIIVWTVGAFIAGVVCTSIVFATNLLKKGRKAKESVTEKKEEQNAG